MKALYLLLLWPMVFVSCTTSETPTSSNTAARPDTLVLALDWSPNVLHAGILFAETKGWFDSIGVHLAWFSTEIDNYTKKPILRVMDGEADLAIGPTEHMLHYAMDSLGGISVQAIGTLLQRDQSVFVTKKAANISRPADFSNSTYVGYHTPMEEAILATMIETDGGIPIFKSITPPRLDVWDAFLADRGDIVWIFTHWEGQLAAADSIALHSFYPSDYGVPYGYSSVVFAPAKPSAQQANLYPKFWRVATRGYQAVRNEPRVAAKWLCKHIDHPNFSDSAFITAAFIDILPAFFTEQGEFGVMQEDHFSRYLSWMVAHNLIDQSPIVTDLFTNKYIIAK